MTESYHNGDVSVPCGLYRTTKPVANMVQAGVLVFYHNHGDPGPGIYPVERWSHNKAVFAKRGVTVPDDSYARSLEPLKAEGFYRVEEPFYCCEKKCRLFEEDTLVQLGYDGKANAILFLPEWSHDGVDLPERGTHVTDDALERLKPVKMVQKFRGESSEPKLKPTPPGSIDVIH